jgi:CrcB protein
MEGGSWIWLAVAAGGALGAVMRATIYRAVERWSPVGTRGFLNRLGIARATLVVNVLGSLALGLALGWLPALPAGSEPGCLRLFWVTGLCGSLTTFSTFCADAIGLVWRGDVLRLAAYLLANGVLCLAAIALGIELTA